jgi:hypothetical protein
VHEGEWNEFHGASRRVRRREMRRRTIKPGPLSRPL